ncbi:Flavohemoprotein [Streptomyces badius]
MVTSDVDALRDESPPVALPAEGSDGLRVGEEELRSATAREQLVHVVRAGHPVVRLDPLPVVAVVEKSELPVVDQLVLLALAQRLDREPQLLLGLVHRLVVEVGDPAVDLQHGLGDAQLVLAGRRVVVDEGVRDDRLADMAGEVDRPDIADLFYEKLFAARPELLRDLFNRGNQASGNQRRALAGSIAAFATALVERPGTRPDVMLERIAHKHASLGVTAEQYEVVHTHLFAAIADVLGDAVTPEVAAAWDEVYWLMAGSLIAVEERLYAQRGVLAGDVWQAWEVAGRVEETEDVATFLLRPAEDMPAPAFRPGQYVSVQVELPDGARQIRQYSLSCAPGSRLRSMTVARARPGLARRSASTSPSCCSR